MKRADILKFLDWLGNKDAQLDPKEMINAMVSIIPADTGQFRNVLPKAVEEFVKTQQKEA